MARRHFETEAFYREQTKDAAPDRRHSEISEFFWREAVSGLADIRDTVVFEGWSGRSTSQTRGPENSLGWELPDDRRNERAAEDPFGHRWSASDQKQQSAERDHPHELDFDR